MAKKWCPDKAGEEMAALFVAADEIMSKPIYQDKTSADSVDGNSTSSSPAKDKPITGDH